MAEVAPIAPLLGMGVLSRAWVRSVLEVAGFEAAKRLEHVRVVALSSEAGAFGDVYRLQLAYAGSARNAPRSLIVKLASHVAANRAQARSFDMYAREARFYRDLAPALTLRVPSCICTGCGEGSADAVLVLEDLGSLPKGDQLTGLDPDRAELAVRQMAGVHAQWWESERLGHLGWLQPLGRWSNNRIADECNQRWPAFARTYRAYLEDGGHGLRARLLADLDDALTSLASRPMTFLHGDFRADNLFFDVASRERPVAVIDWQLCCRGRAAFDVAYLICQSVRVEERRRHEVSILRSWHSSLVGAGVSGYSFDDAVADYRRGAQLCLAYAVLGSALERTGRAAAEARAQVERTVAAALDLVVA